MKQEEVGIWVGGFEEGGEGLSKRRERNKKKQERKTDRELH